MPILEPNFYGLWVGKQTAKGTPNTTPGKRLVQVSGGFTINRDDGTEVYSDLTKYGANTDWVNSVLGSGEPAVEASPTELAYILWLFHGAETVTSVAGPPAASKHSFQPSTGRGHYFTAFQRIGNTVIRRHQHNDCLVTRVQIEGSTGNKAVRITPRILSLDPGKPYTADPAASLPTDKCFLYTDGVGSFTIDGVAFSGHSQFTFVIDDAWEPVYADDTVPFDLVQGTPVVTIGVTVYFDATAQTRWNVLVYGTGTPAAGTAPSKAVSALGSYAFNLVQKDATGAATGRRFVLSIPGVKWAIPEAPQPNPDGGATEMALAGAMRPTSPGAVGYTIDVYTASADTAFTT